MDAVAPINSYLGHHHRGDAVQSTHQIDIKSFWNIYFRLLDGIFFKQIWQDLIFRRFDFMKPYNNQILHNSWTVTTLNLSLPALTMSIKLID